MFSGVQASAPAVEGRDAAGKRCYATPPTSQRATLDPMSRFRTCFFFERSASTESAPAWKTFDGTSSSLKRHPAALLKSQPLRALLAQFCRNVAHPKERRVHELVHSGTRLLLFFPQKMTSWAYTVFSPNDDNMAVLLVRKCAGLRKVAVVRADSAGSGRSEVGRGSDPTPQKSLH